MIGDLDTAARTAMAATIAGAVRGQVLGRESAADDSADRIAAAAVAYLIDVAPKTPEAIGTEAAIRFAGWLYGSRPHVTEQEVTDPSGTTVKLRFTNSAATANGFRASGASALVSRYTVRHARPIG